MFYSQFILAKKGPLGTIWIAAHLERKLRKNQVADTDIGVSVDSILFPDVPIALRLSSHLLLGVVRIYSRKVNYLFDDCSEALLKVKQAFRSAAVDLPPEQSKAPYHSITLPETFDLDDFEIPDNEIFQGSFVDHHVSAREQITIQDNMDGAAFPTSQFGPDERFGDGDASQIGLDFDEELFLDKVEAADTSGILMDTGYSADRETSIKASSPFKGDENNKRISESAHTFPVNCFTIQAPSTPGLMEEPDLPRPQETVVSDDHMDEDHTPLESAAKEVGTLNLSEQENEKARSAGVEPSTQAMEHISSGNGQLDKSNDIVGNIFNGCMDHGKKSDADDQPKRPCEDEGRLNGIASPSTESASIMEIHNSDLYNGSIKTDLNETCLLLSDNKKENNNASAGVGVPGTGESNVNIISTGVEAEIADQSCLDANTAETSTCNINERLLVPSVPTLQFCNARIHHACNGTSSFVGASDPPAEDDGLQAPENSDRGDLITIVSEVSVEVRDNGNINRKVDSTIGQEDNLVKKLPSDISDLLIPEKLRSMPDLPVEQSNDFLVECTPGKEDLAEGNGDITTEKLIAGRKRSYTESTLTIQSLNSAESSGATQSKRSIEFVPEDDDLLSSILAGRKSTALKLKPTPSVTQSLPSKRQRVSIRSSVHKRKVLVDDATVLHGDIIRQQLTYTEDIRRVRKKAPCTHQEIWTLQKQILEDEIFSEPVFTGISPDLLHLHSETLDLSRIVIIQDDQSKDANEVDTATRPTFHEENEYIGSLPSVAGRDQGLAENLVENDEDTVYRVSKTEENEVRKEGSEDNATDERFVKDIGDGSVLLGDEPLGTEQAMMLGLISEVNCDRLDEAVIGSPSLDKAGDTVPGNNDASWLLLDQVGDVQCKRDDTFTLEGVSGEKMMDQEGANVIVSERLDSDERLDGKHSSVEIEIKTTVIRKDTQDPSLSPLHNVGEIQSLHFEDGACPTSDHFMGENQFTETGIAKMHEISDFDSRCDASSPNHIYHASEELKLDSSHTIETDFGSANTVVVEGENLKYFEADPKNFMGFTPVCNDYVDAGGHADIEMDVVEHDTDFLNVDDDEVAEDFEGDIPSTDEKCILDNSGWSARTRAVANYLQVLFEKEDHDGKKDVSLESLLVGKSRKEASRMFFETLVLKTKDYILAEQGSSFCDIRIKPQGKLLKSEF